MKNPMKNPHLATVVAVAAVLGPVGAALALFGARTAAEAGNRGVAFVVAATLLGAALGVVAGRMLDAERNVLTEVVSLLRSLQSSDADHDPKRPRV